MELPVNYNGLTQNQRRLVREKYIKLQEGKCSHCGNHLSQRATDEVMKKPIDKSLFPSGFFKHLVHLHHNHVTGMTIGAVHCRCNAVLWQYNGI